MGEREAGIGKEMLAPESEGRGRQNPLCILMGHFLFNLHAVLKRAAIKKSKNDLIHAEEGEDHFTDICSVGEYWLRIPRGFDST